MNTIEVFVSGEPHGTLGVLIPFIRMETGGHSTKFWRAST